LDVIAHSLEPLTVCTIEHALTHSWPYDAHMVAYVLHGPDGRALKVQPRIRKDALPRLQERGYSLRYAVIFAEADLPIVGKDKLRWSDLEGGDACARAVLDAAEELRGCVWHPTKRGLHVLAVLDEPHADGTLYERQLAWLRAQIAPALARIVIPGHEQHRLAPDHIVKDWTRVFRLPRVLRGKEREPQRYDVDLSRIAPVRPDVSSIRHYSERTSERRVRTVRVQLPLVHSIERTQTACTMEERAPAERVIDRAPRTVTSTSSPACPDEWREHVQAIADAMVEYTEAWHPVYLAIAGALIDGGVPYELVPVLIAAISEATGRDSGHDRVRECAIPTIDRARRGGEYTSSAWLSEHAPGVYALVEDALRAWRSWSASEGSDLPSVDECRATMSEWLTLPVEHPVRVLAPAVGIGKSTAVLHAAARGDRRYSLAVPTTKLAKELYAKACELGIPVARLCSPPTESDAHERPLCAIQPRAKECARGGLPVVRELCEGNGDEAERCVHYDSCLAHDVYETHGCRSPASARLIVGTHAMLPMLARYHWDRERRAYRDDSVLVIDEPPSPLSEYEYTTASISKWIEQSDDVISRALKASVVRVLTRVMDAISSAGAEQRAVTEICPEEVLAGVRAHIPNNNTIPVRPQAIQRARRSDAAMVRLADVTETVSRVWAIAQTADRWTLTVADGRAYLLGPNADLIACSEHPRVVILDATPDLRALEVLSGRSIPDDAVLRLEARDAAPVERVHVYSSSVSRAAIELHDGMFDRERVARVLAHVINLVSSRAPSAHALLLITYKAVREAIERALREPEREPEIAPVLSRWTDAGRRIDLLHYGNVRGYDAFGAHDVCVTLGDPFDNLGAAQRRARMLAMSEDAREDWYRERALAELTQAHGRLRAVTRDKPALIVHVGRLRPQGTAWRFAERITLPSTPGVPPSIEAIRECYARTGSVSATARELGVDRKTVRSTLAARVTALDDAGDDASSRTSPGETSLVAQGPLLGMSPHPVSGYTLAQHPTQLIARVLSARGWTRGDLARDLGVTDRTLRRYEHGATRAPSRVIERLQRLADGGTARADFAARATALMERRQWSRAWLAEQLALDERTLQGYLRGEPLATADVCARLDALMREPERIDGDDSSMDDVPF
jgi:ribosome-binding protein aMBF1 (putative translation factor)